ncbi:type II secretion system minor pseudopilin GspK [[Enterobacter] lignolyticus]|uniref:Type II secretion system protein K n=1 Tax=Enterobacter lignolyticus (strain SCF1) TaxID=701347 RepID=E3G243_ENTLS|nr:type II secretion system minor pseudopilin GspK [[Enterobacter] lignolyticus]ADO49177.1 general secretion pathway protein K [[Enterobacter] lignolyticus SCF1]
MNNAQTRQRGVALLVVLILLVMMSVLAGRISQQFCRSLQKTRYQLSQQQLRWGIQAQEKVIGQKLQTLTGDKSLASDGDWRDPVITRGEFYTVESAVTDAQTCFNVNSLLAEEPAQSGAAPEKAQKERIVEALFARAGISEQTAQTLYGQLRDYLDADDVADGGRKESEAWAGLTPARFPANQMMRTPGEIRALPAFPAAAWPVLSRLMCALPATTGAVDVNTLAPEQAPLLAAVYDGVLSDDEAARLIASRPEAGWESVQAFEEQLLRQLPVKKEDLERSREFVSVSSRYFRVDSRATTDDLTLRVVTQLQVNSSTGDVAAWQRRYRIVE